MKPILHTIMSSASDHGYHSYSTIATCPRKAQLAKAARENGETGLESNNAFSVGIIGHSYLELFFNKALGKHGTAAVKFSDVVDEEARFAAEQCVRGYIAKHPNPHIFGKILGVEHEIKAGNEVVEEAVGISPYTARLDLITQMTTGTISALKKEFEIEGPGVLKPGQWIVDHKFLGQRDRYLVERYSQSHQATSYQQAATAELGKIEGMIINCIFKKKQKNMPVPSDRFLLIVLPPPSHRQIKSLHTLYDWAVTLENGSPNQAIPTEDNCMSFFGPCRFWLDGSCPRY